MLSPLSSQTVNVLIAAQASYPSDIRIAIRHLPQSFHPDAQLAHTAALAAGEQGKFWEMQGLILGHQKINQTQLVQYAKGLGLDEKRFVSALKEQTSVLEQDKAAGRKREVRGVPTLFINGQRIDGTPDLKAVLKKVEDALDLKSGG
jgi:protein-disulfide isomerase